MLCKQAITFRSACTHGPAIVVTCPKCKCCATFIRGTLPHIDSCGFESHSFHCGWCGSFLAGVIDPSDGELIVSLLEEPSGVAATPISDPSSGHHDLQCDTRFHGTKEQSSSYRD